MAPSSTSVAALGTDFYVPAYEIKVGGRPVDRQAVRDVLSVSFTDSLESIDSFSMVVNDWDEEYRTFKYSEGDLFAPGQRLELSMGYRGRDLVRMLVGEITSLQPAFPAESPPTLTVGGLSLLHRFRREHRSEVYVDMKDSDIARKIAGNLEDVVIETSAEARAAESKIPFVVQDNKQDVVFLLHRARRIGYELTVHEREDGTAYLFFGPQSKGTDLPFALEWGRSLLSFDPKLTTANQVGSVLVRSWHPTKKELIEVKATRADLRLKEPFPEAFDKRQEVIADQPVASEAEARQLALETLRRIAHHHVTASASTIGLPELRTGSLVRIERVGRLFEGSYFVTSSTHSIGDGGYTTSFEARRETSS